MQWVWLIPSLAYGIYLFVTTGQPYGLIFGGFSALAMVGGQLMQNRLEPVDPRQPVRFGANRVAIGNRVLPKWQSQWQAVWVSAVYQALQEANNRHNAALAIEHRLSGDLAVADPDRQGLTGWLGVAGSQQIELDLASEGAHGFIVGATGSGKSQLLTCWLVSLCQAYPDTRLRLWLFDFKGGATLARFSALPWAEGLWTDLEGEVNAALAALLAEMQRREQLLAREGFSRIQDLGPGSPPAILVVIDEVQVLLQDPGSQRYLEALAARGRSLGIHLLLSSQSLSGIPRGLLANLGVRIAVGRPDPVDLAQLGMTRSGLGPQPDSRAAEQELVRLDDPRFAPALLITPVRQVAFQFPTRGLVDAARLRPRAHAKTEIDFEAIGGQNGHQNRHNYAESVVEGQNTYGFSIGL